MEPKPFLVRRGSGMPIVFVHGLAIDHRALLPLDECFDRDKDFERIYLDLPGFGLTPVLTGIAGLPELANWLVETVADLVGDAPFAVVGNSMGGLLARHVASQFPRQVTGLGLIAPLIEPDSAKRTVPPKRVIARDDGLLDALSDEDRKHFEENSAVHSRESWELFEEFVLPGLRIASTRAVANLSRRYFLNEVSEDRAAKTDIPTLILTGKQDDVVGYQDQLRLLDHYTSASYAALEGAGHNVHIEQPDISAKLFGDWLNRVSAQKEGTG